MKIPKIIHFIWAGGDWPIPLRDINVIKYWHKSNPSFDIWLWIDPASAGNERVKKDHQKSYDLLSAAIQDKFQLKDIKGTIHNEEKIQVEDEYIRYEIDRLRPNYGASSDLLRYKILYLIGGAYFDSDVLPGNNSLEESQIFDRELSEHTLYVDANSQNSGMIGNDALICTPNNPAMNTILENAKRHYTLRLADIPENCEDGSEAVANYNSPDQIAYLYDDASPNGYIMRSTLYKTGPYCVRKIIDDEWHSNETYDKLHQSKIIKMQRLTTSTFNNRGWIGKELGKYTFDSACSKTRLTIEFDLKILGILRLSDYIDNLSLTTGIKHEEAEKAVLHILGDIKSHDNATFSDIKGLQLTFEHDAATEYCKQNNLLKYTYLFPLIGSCRNETKDDEYYKLALSVVITGRTPYQDKLAFLFEQFSKSEISPNKLIKELTARAQFINKFVNYALNYCDELISVLTNNKTRTPGKLDLISLYLEAMQDNLTIVSNEYQRFLSSANNDMQSQNLTEIIPRLVNSINSNNKQINDFLINHKIEKVTPQQSEVKAETNNNQKDNNDDDENKPCCRLS
ncbi:MAG TPA: TcdA/TcdB catalytic glycosyltransferase domain-containing protein [Gammaproteobacteria bacterium]|nr:TcdA/TcdB catalytic glycosyltransferase domain-containing protein [Gammaproteobacteria bacterium]